MVLARLIVLGGGVLGFSLRLTLGDSNIGSACGLLARAFRAGGGVGGFVLRICLGLMGPS